MSARGRRRLALILAILFAIAMVMGPGPGLRLVNPDVDGPRAGFTLLGLPVIYAWGLLWYGVQVAVVVTAYFALWRHDDAPVDGENSP